MKIPVYTFPEMFNNSDPLSNFNINKIRFSDTSYLDQDQDQDLDKRCNKHIIDMYYKNNCIIFQLPRQKLHDIKENVLTLQLNNSDINEYIIKPLEEHICEMVHKYSEKWFNGKHFTMNKIVNSLQSQIKKQEPKYDFILHLTLNKNTLLYNRYKTLIELDHVIINLAAHEDSDIELITLIRLSHLEFYENKFTYNLVLEQAKIFMQEKLTCYSIIETHEDSESNSNNDSDNEKENYYKESLDGSKQNFF